MRQRLLRSGGYWIGQGADWAAPSIEAAPAWPVRPSNARSPILEVECSLAGMEDHYPS
jgi:hypothetical protein